MKKLMILLKIHSRIYIAFHGVNSPPFISILLCFCCCIISVFQHDTVRTLRSSHFVVVIRIVIYDNLD